MSWLEEATAFDWEDDIPVAPEFTPMDPKGRTCLVCGKVCDIYEAETRVCEDCADDMET